MLYGLLPTYSSLGPAMVLDLNRGLAILRSGENGGKMKFYLPLQKDGHEEKVLNFSFTSDQS